MVKKLYVINFKNEKSKIVIEHKKDNITYFLNRDELINSLSLDSKSIVFVGNSLTQYFPLEEMFSNINIKNRGISGDVLPGVLKRLKPIVDSKPKKIFIEIGINDLGNGIKKEILIDNYKRLIVFIRLKSPNTKLYVQSIFPIENKREGVTVQESKKINADIIEINNRLIELSSKDDFTFINTHKAFICNNELNHLYSVDGVHLNSAGYKLWRLILLPYVNN